MTGPSHEPLDEQEREFARILRALPGAEPPAALDQRILRAAADAAASSRRPVRRWLAFGGAGWGIGSAAAAVLALGVGWHLLDPARNVTMERSAPVAAPAQEDAIAVDLGDARAPAAELAAPAAPSAVQQAEPAVAQAARPALRREPREAPAAAPPPPPAPVVTPETGLNAIDVASVESTTILSAEQIAKLPVEERAREQADAAQRAESEAAAGLISRQAQAKAADAAAPARNGAMTPARWLADIRALRDADRRAEAADSLRRFHQYYPQYAIPADLLPLMRE